MFVDLQFMIQLGIPYIRIGLIEMVTNAVYSAIVERVAMTA